MGNVRNYDFESLRTYLVSLMKADKKAIKKGSVRYELLRGYDDGFNSIDEHQFGQHNALLAKQGFVETSRTKEMIGPFQVERVVLRHTDENLMFIQFDGFLTGYLQTGCEYVFHQIIF